MYPLVYLIAKRRNPNSDHQDVHHQTLRDNHHPTRSQHLSLVRETLATPNDNRATNIYKASPNES